MRNCHRAERSALDVSTEQVYPRLARTSLRPVYRLRTLQLRFEEVVGVWQGGLADYFDR